MKAGLGQKMAESLAYSLPIVFLIPISVLLLYQPVQLQS